MKRIMITAATAVVLAVPTVALVGTADAAARTYSSCAKLQKDFPNGVSKSKAAARKQLRAGNSLPASSKRAQQVYQANKSRLDRDKDGTACEN